MPCVSTPADIFLVFRTLLNCLKCIIYEDYYNYYTDFFELGQQKINFSFYELSLPDDDPFSTLKKVMEDLDFSDLLDSIELTFTRYNTFLQENGYGLKYDIGTAQMFVIEGMDKVRSVIEKNRKRKLSKHKKLANNTVIEIDNCSPLEILKLQDHEKRKTRAYAEDISKYYNMKVEVFEDEQFYICHDGRELRHIRTETKEQNGDTQTFEVYSCADCSGCEHKARCLYKYNAEKDTERNKVMKINEQWEELREKSHANIQSERGILKRQTRSIQTEGHFGDIKENENFRRFNYRSADKVYKEFMLYAIGRNINKYCRFLNEKLKKFEGKTTEKTA